MHKLHPSPFVSCRKKGAANLTFKIFAPNFRKVAAIQFFFPEFSDLFANFLKGHISADVKVIDRFQTC